MPTIKKDNSAGNFHIDEGEYPAIVKGIKEQEGQHGTFYVWSFKVIGPTNNGEEVENDVTVSGPTPAFLQDGSKLDDWLKAMGVSVEDKEVADLDEAVGKRVRIVVVDNDGKNGKVYSKVEKVMAPKSKPKEEPEEEEEEEKPAKKTEVKKTEVKKVQKEEKPKSKPKEEPEPEEESEKSDDDEEELLNFD